MIDELHIQNLALISNAGLVFSPKFTVLTGETGSGKSAVLNALKLLVGDRADQGWLKEGTDKLQVEGRYFLDDDDSEDGVVIKRTMSSDGKSRVHIDGAMSSVKALAQGYGSSVDMLGQHEHQSLLKAQAHPDIYDAWIGTEALDAKASYEQAYQEKLEAQEAYNSALALAEDKSGELEEARVIVDKISKVNPKPHEYDELMEVLNKLEHADSLVQMSSEVYELLEGEEGLLEKLSYARDLVFQISDIDESISGESVRIDSALIELGDIAHEVRAYRDSIDLDDAKLEELRVRHQDLQMLMRAYGPSLEEVLSTYEQAQKRVSISDDAEFYINEAKKALDKSEKNLLEKAQDWFDIRRAHTESFSSQVSEYLHRLEMEQSSFEVDLKALEPEDFSAHKAHQLEFKLSPSKDVSPKSLAQIASGGEASRVMLAIKAVMGQSDKIETLIFDEVDAGIGGQTALAVGEILSELSETHQVIVVSHLPQIAVCADTHYLVYKSSNSEGALESCVKLLEGEKRVEEISRMLAGEHSTNSMSYARELLEKAGEL